MLRKHITLSTLEKRTQKMHWRWKSLHWICTLCFAICLFCI